MINNDADEPMIMTPVQFIEERFKPLMQEGKLESFYEIEIKHMTEVFGKIAQRFSTYETKFQATDPKPYSIGINSIQMIKIRESWFISCMVLIL